MEHAVLDVIADIAEFLPVASLHQMAQVSRSFREAVLLATRDLSIPFVFCAVGRPTLIGRFFFNQKQCIIQGIGARLTQPHVRVGKSVVNRQEDMDDIVEDALEVIRSTPPFVPVTVEEQQRWSRCLSEVERDWESAEKVVADASPISEWVGVEDDERKTNTQRTKEQLRRLFKTREVSNLGGLGLKQPKIIAIGVETFTNEICKLLADAFRLSLPPQCKTKICFFSNSIDLSPLHDEAGDTKKRRTERPTPSLTDSEQTVVDALLPYNHNTFCTEDSSLPPLILTVTNHLRRLFLTQLFLMNSKGPVKDRVIMSYFNASALVGRTFAHHYSMRFDEEKSESSFGVFFRTILEKARSRELTINNPLTEVDFDKFLLPLIPSAGDDLIIEPSEATSKELSQGDSTTTATWLKMLHCGKIVRFRGGVCDLPAKVSELILRAHLEVGVNEFGQRCFVQGKQVMPDWTGRSSPANCEAYVVDNNFLAYFFDENLYFPNHVLCGLFHEKTGIVDSAPVVLVGDSRRTPTELRHSALTPAKAKCMENWSSIDTGADTQSCDLTNHDSSSQKEEEPPYPLPGEEALLDTPWLLLGRQGTFSSEHAESMESHIWCHVFSGQKTWFVQNPNTKAWSTFKQEPGETLVIPPNLRHVVRNSQLTLAVARNFLLKN